MPEQTSNVEFAHKIHEQSHHHRAGHGRSSRWVELAEAIALAVVAVATAWSGYQATKWDALSDQNYSLASRTTVMAQEKATLAGQDRLYDIVTFNGWIAAENAGNQALATLYEHRFRPEYTVAFLAWQKLDPLKNPSAPPGPLFMAEYTNESAQESRRLVEEANGYFEKAVNTRETGDHYVKVSVFLDSSDGPPADRPWPEIRDDWATNRRPCRRVHSFDDQHILDRYVPTRLKRASWVVSAEGKYQRGSWFHLQGRWLAVEL